MNAGQRYAKEMMRGDPKSLLGALQHAARARRAMAVYLGDHDRRAWVDANFRASALDRIAFRYDTSRLVES